MYNQDQRKVVLVGTGMVGMSYAYALLNQPICNELVLIDIDKKKAEGEAMDLNHGLAFASSHMKIRAGEYADCHDADLVVICAGVLSAACFCAGLTGSYLISTPVGATVVLVDLAAFLLSCAVQRIRRR